MPIIWDPLPMSAAGTGWERVVCVSLFNHSWSTFALWGVAILEHNSEVGGGLTQEERKALAQGSPSLEGIPNKNQRAFTWVHTTWWQRKDFFFFFFITSSLERGPPARTGHHKGSGSAVGASTSLCRPASCASLMVSNSPSLSPALRLSLLFHVPGTLSHG